MGNFSETAKDLFQAPDAESAAKEVVAAEDVIVQVSSDKAVNKCLWTPIESDVASSKMHEFQSLIEKKYQLKFDSYVDLYKWSIENYVTFWEEVWHFTNIISSKPYDRVLDKSDSTIDNLPFKWFEGALLNYAENLLRFNDDNIAFYSTGESFTQIKSITFKQLRQRVGIYQRALKKLGVKCGDIVVGYLPNCIECAEAKLAVLSLGAVWSCAPPDFGAHSVVDRFIQIKPKVMFSVTSVSYNGKRHDHIKKLNEVIKNVETIENVIIVPFVDDVSDSIETIPKSILLADFLLESEAEVTELEFEQVAFNHPLVILYSSGTTGTPKCIVHSHGGTLIQHLKEHILHANMTRKDVIFYYTSTGWMMYDWLLTTLAVGSTCVLFDGSPFLPTDDILWNLVDKLGITIFGVSAKYLGVIEDKGMKPKMTHGLKQLRIIYSTGSPLKPSSYDYVYESIKSDLLLGSITGGSDIISLFCGINSNLPVNRGQIQCRQLGMAIECWNPSGKPVYDQCGEFICTKPFPSMPTSFYNDNEYKRYKASYFEKYPNVWTHGDFCLINEKTGGVHMLGRSDGTLNPNGIRFGSADIYNVIENVGEIEDSLCVGQRNPSVLEEERVILFIKVKEGSEFNKVLVDKVKVLIRSSLSPRHVPSLILQIEEIPYTINGKKVEVPVRRIIEGGEIEKSSALVNPKCLEYFKELDVLKKW